MERTAKHLIAVTGATGQLGRRVAEELSRRGVSQRLIVRDVSRAPKLDGADAVVADYADRDALSVAFSGVDTVFFVSGHEDRDRISLHRGVVETMASVGVRRVVYTSFMGAAPNATFTYARDHALTERAIREAGMSLTALRSALYADVAPWFVGKDDVIRGPAGDGRVAWVARRDIARLAAHVLLDDAHCDQVYDLSGPVAIGFSETARILSRAVGRTIRYERETEVAARKSRAGAEEWQIDGWVGSYLAVATGETSVTSHTIEHVTGQRPWTLEELLSEEPESWRHLVTVP